MPNPMFLAVMKTPLYLYNTYTAAKKERFQKEAAKRLAELHESDIDGYEQLTQEVAAANEQVVAEAANAEKEDIREEWSK